MPTRKRRGAGGRGAPRLCPVPDRTHRKRLLRRDRRPRAANGNGRDRSAHGRNLLHGGAEGDFRRVPRNFEAAPRAREDAQAVRWSHRLTALWTKRPAWESVLGNPSSKRWGTPSSGRMRGSPPDGGPNRLRDPFRPLSRGGRTLPAPLLHGGASRRVGQPAGARGTFSTGCRARRGQRATRATPCSKGPGRVFGAGRPAAGARFASGPPGVAAAAVSL